MLFCFYVYRKIAVNKHTSGDILSIFSARSCHYFISIIGSKGSWISSCFYDKNGSYPKHVVEIRLCQIPLHQPDHKTTVQPHAHPPLLLRSKTFPSQTLCALFCPCVSNNKCSQYGHLSSRSLGGTLYHRPPITSKEPIALRISDSRAKRRPDVNKHEGILPSKTLNYCCGQCHLTCHVG